MRRPSAPLFLARAVYRQRRLRDAARLLPLVGLFLLLLPLLWGRDAPVGQAASQAAGGPTAGAGGLAVFLFAVWAVLIALAAYLAPALVQPEADGSAEGR